MTRASDEIVFTPKRAPLRKFLLLAFLLAALALAAYLVYYFTLNRHLPNAASLPSADKSIPAPQYLYSISGTGQNALGRPVGVAISSDGRLFVSDAIRGRISIFTLDGKFISSFQTVKDGKNTKLKTPVHLTFDAKGDLYVTDRALDAVYVFDGQGRYLRKFTPAGISKVKWSPLALAFDSEGLFYLSDVGNTAQHHITVYDQTGRKLRQWGRTEQVDQMNDSPGRFYFPNGISVSKDGLVFVADGNNRRVQVFDRNGKYQYMIGTSGIPRGVQVDDVNKRLIVADALSQQIDIYTLKGEKLVSFGDGGVGPGQFQYPNDLVLDAEGRIYIADRENHQVQVWGWPKAAIPAGVVQVAQRWYWCLTPLLLLPLLLLRRRREFVLTPDFVDALVTSDALPVMTRPKFRWVAPEPDHAAHYAGRVEGGIDLGALIQPEAYSASDAKDLAEKLRVDEAVAALLAMAKRSGRLATEDVDVRRLALMLGIEVFDAAEFAERFPAPERR